MDVDQKGESRGGRRRRIESTRRRKRNEEGTLYFPGSMSVSSSIPLNRRIIGWTGLGELNQGLEISEVGRREEYFPSIPATVSPFF